MDPDSLQYAHVFPALGSTGASRQCEEKEKDDLPQPAAIISPSAAQEAVGLLCLEGAFAGSWSNWCPPETPGPLL